jgi:6-phosphogluconolactonase
MATRVIVAADPEAAAAAAADIVVETVTARAAGGGECCIALCGGTTPSGLYRQLASPPLAEKIPWDHVQIFFGDERDVAQDHVENNYRLASKTLLDFVPVRMGNVHPMPADCRDLVAAAEQYEGLVTRLVRTGPGGTPVFDLILLGMGADAHTASLFPDTPALNERHRLVTAQFVPVIGRNRMTFTFPLINAAANVMFLVTGPDKAAAVGAVTAAEPGQRTRLPAAGVRPDGDLIFVLDEDAARNVPDEMR